MRLSFKFFALCSVVLWPVGFSAQSAAAFKITVRGASCPSFTNWTPETTRNLAQQSVPALMRHGFDEDGFALSGLSVFIAIPKIYTPQCSIQLFDYVNGIEQLDDDVLRGWIMQGGDAHGLIENDQAIVFSRNAIVDWRYTPDGSALLTFGDFMARQTGQGTRGGEGQTLSPNALPAEWQ